MVLSLLLLAGSGVVFAAAGSAEYGRNRKGSRLVDIEVRRFWSDFDEDPQAAIQSLERLIHTLAKGVEMVPELEDKKNDLERQLRENQNTLDINTAEIRESFEKMKESVQILSHRYHSGDAEDKARAEKAREILRSGHSDVRLLEELANTIKFLKEQNAVLEKHNRSLNVDKENIDRRLQILYNYFARINMYSNILELQKAERAEYLELQKALAQQSVTKAERAE